MKLNAALRVLTEIRRASTHRHRHLLAAVFDTDYSDARGMIHGFLHVRGMAGDAVPRALGTIASTLRRS